MTRAIRPGSIQAAVRASLTALGGLECAADDLGTSISTLSLGCEAREDRPGGLGVNHLDRAGRIDRAAAQPIAQHFAHLAGGVFHPVDISGAAGAHIHEITREFADVIALHARVHSEVSDAPHDYTPDEARAQIAEVDELIAVSMLYRAVLEAKGRGEA